MPELTILIPVLIIVIYALLAPTAEGEDQLRVRIPPGFWMDESA